MFGQQGRPRQGNVPRRSGDVPPHESSSSSGERADRAGQETPPWFGPIGRTGDDALGEEPRRGRRRDRHGHGPRGPLAMASPLVPSGMPSTRTRAQRFDELVLDAIERLEDRFSRELDGVEFAVEDVPDPARYQPDGVPLATTLSRSLAPPTDEDPRPDQVARIVVYRRPIELRAPTQVAEAALIRDVVVEQVADLLGLAPEDVDPNYGEDDLD